MKQDLVPEERQRMISKGQMPKGEGLQHRTAAAGKGSVNVYEDLVRLLAEGET